MKSLSLIKYWYQKRKSKYMEAPGEKNSLITDAAIKSELIDVDILIFAPLLMSTVFLCVGIFMVPESWLNSAGNRLIVSFCLMVLGFIFYFCIFPFLKRRIKEQEMTPLIVQNCKEKFFYNKIMSLEELEELSLYCNENDFKSFLKFSERKPTYQKLEVFISEYKINLKEKEEEMKIDELALSIYKKKSQD